MIEGVDKVVGCMNSVVNAEKSKEKAAKALIEDLAILQNILMHLC